MGVDAMKYAMFVSTLIAALMVPLGSEAELVIDAKSRNKIGEIIKRPVPVYTLDSALGDSIQERFDSWAETHLSISKAKRRSSAVEGQESFVVSMQTNSPISLSDVSTQGILSSRPFEILYFKGRRRRQFVKNIDVPSLKELPKEIVEKIGRDFISCNRFCRQTNIDRIGKAEVVARVRRQVKESGGLGPKLVLSQNVIFTRDLAEMKVFNSKQSVAVHPESREILSYRVSRWTPVDEESSRMLPYESLDTILERITDRYARSPLLLEVADVSPGMYQEGEMVFPVVRIKVKTTVQDGKIAPGLKTLIIGLAKGLRIGEEKTKSRRRPRETSRRN
jgi:hypothetical protein